MAQVWNRAGVVTIGVLAAGWATAADAAVIRIGSATSVPGGSVTIAVSLQTEGQMVLATQNRIDFERAAAIAARGDGEPDCAVNPAIDKDATGFRFLPLGCDPAVDCESVRTFVIAFDNLDPIPDGSVLYTCRVAIAATAADGTHPLAIAEVGASAAGGVLLPSSGIDGAVEVSSEPVASINIGSATGAPNDLLEIAVTLDLLGAPPASVVGAVNQITFDPATPIVQGELGSGPACAVNPAIDKVATFAFTPEGCVEDDSCTGVSAVVAPDTNDDPIADGATLYTCTIVITPAAAPGTYQLVNGNTQSIDPSNQFLPAAGTDGTVTVTEPPPACVGDCRGDGAVTIDDLILGVNIAIGGVGVEACRAFDPDGGGTVVVSELVQGVNNALTGCPS